MHSLRSLQASLQKRTQRSSLSRRHTRHDEELRNFGNIEATEVRNLNPVSVLSAKYLVIANPEAAFATLLAKKVASAKGKKAAPVKEKKVAKAKAKVAAK
jgi:hypothetical protein